MKIKWTNPLLNKNLSNTYYLSFAGHTGVDKTVKIACPNEDYYILMWEDRQIF